MKIDKKVQRNVNHVDMDDSLSMLGPKGPEPDVTSENILRPDVLGQFPSDPRRLILTQLGVWVLEGCAEVDGGSSAGKIQGYMVSGRQMRAPDIAWRIDQRGGDWVQWQTAPLPRDVPVGAEVVFVFGMAMGVGDPLPQPSEPFALYVNDRHVVTFRFVKHTEVWRGDGASFCYQVKKVRTVAPGETLGLDDGTRSESAASYGLGLLRMPVRGLPAGKPVILRVKGRNKVPTTRWFRLDAGSAVVRASEDYGTLTEINYWQGLLRIAGGDRHHKVGPYRIFFGDLHAHSGLSDDPKRPGCGAGTPEENYRYARDVANLDFFALAEHEWQMPEGRSWELRQDLAERFDEDGRFVTLLSYEWGLRYGQRCVYYELGGQPIFSSREGAAKPTELWDCLRRARGRAITIPHHPAWTKSPLDLSYHDPEFERLMEVYSCWGNFEYDGALHPGSFDRFEGRCLRDVLGLGYRVGTVASSDGHDGHPGDAQAMSSKHHPHLYHYLGSGRAAVVAEELTRQAVFDALYCRRTYGTTGEPIALDFQVNDVLMGGEIPADGLKQPPEIRVKAVGTTPLARIVLIRNGEITHVQTCDSHCGHVVWRDPEYGSAAYYYVRVEQADGEMAWSSPIWIVGGDGS